MALPKVRQTRSRTNKRRAHHALKRVAGSSCPKCKEAVLSHTVCKTCGTYKGKEVLSIPVKTKKQNKS